MEQKSQENEPLILETKEQNWDTPSPKTEEGNPNQTETVELSWESKETSAENAPPEKQEAIQNSPPLPTEPKQKEPSLNQETQEKRKSAPKAGISRASKTTAKKRAKEGTQPKKETEESISAVSESVVKSKGIAYLKGNTIRLAGGVKLLYGDEVKIGDKEYVLKPLSQNKKTLWLAGVAFSLLLIFSYFFFFQGTGKDTGKVWGVVYDPVSGNFISNAEVTVEQLGKKVKTNDLGYFMFETLPVGSYTLKTQSTGYPEGKDYATITPQQTTTVTVFLQTTNETNRTGQYQTPPSKTPLPANLKTTDDNKTADQKRFGSLRVESNVPGASVFIDDELVSISGSVVNEIPLGKHILKVSKNGFEDYTAFVDIKSKTITRVNAYLTETKKLKPEELFSSAMAKLEKGNYSQAVEDFTSALKEKPQYPEALFNRGKAYAFLDKSSPSWDDFSLASKYFLEQGNVSKAIDCYTQMINLNPNDPNTYFNRGQAYLLIGESPKAIPDFSKVVQLDSKSFSAYLSLGESYYKAGMYSEGIDALKKAAKLNSNHKQVYILLTKSYFALGKKSDAKKNYQKFAELSSFTDRENMKKDPEWKKLLEALGIKEDTEF